MGGGGHMGRAVVSVVYSELFRKAEPTCMTPALLNYLSITDKHDYVERIYDMIEEKTFDRTACIRIMFQAAEKNDKVALNFFREVSANYAGGISTMIEEMGYAENEVLYVVLAGSVFVKGENPLMINSLKQIVKTHNPNHNINYVVLDVPPVAGAVIWALNTLNGKAEYYDKVCAEFKKVVL
jgi:N-acetylglucosamine kinase-like BadF-type ATPase